MVTVFNQPRYSLIITTTIDGKQSSGWRHLPLGVTGHGAYLEARNTSRRSHVDYVIVEENRDGRISKGATLVNGKAVYA